jgi:hypothetical protein
MPPVWGVGAPHPPPIGAAKRRFKMSEDGFLRAYEEDVIDSSGARRLILIMDVDRVRQEAAMPEAFARTLEDLIMGKPVDQERLAAWDAVVCEDPYAMTKLEEELAMQTSFEWH